jgi:hypothetical protein
MDPNDTNWEVNPPENHPEIGEPAPSASVIGSTGKRVTDKAANRPFLVYVRSFAPLPPWSNLLI